MEQQNKPQISQVKKSVQIPKNILVIVLTTIVMALIFGGGVYVWQNSKIEKIKYEDAKTIEGLQEQVQKLQDQIDKLMPGGVSTLPGDAEGPGDTEDETANWKTYINKKYRFEVRHPLDWKTEIITETLIPSTVNQEGSEPFWVAWSKTKPIEEENDPIGFKEFQITFFIHTTTNPDKPFNEFIEDNCAKWGITKELKVDDRDAIRCVSPTGPAGTTRIWLIKDGIGWEFLISGFYNEELGEIADQILSTFKFID